MLEKGQSEHRTAAAWARAAIVRLLLFVDATKLTGGLHVTDGG